MACARWLVAGGEGEFAVQRLLGVRSRFVPRVRPPQHDTSMSTNHFSSRHYDQATTVGPDVGQRPKLVMPRNVSSPHLQFADEEGHGIFEAANGAERTLRFPVRSHPRLPLLRIGAQRHTCHGLQGTPGSRSLPAHRLIYSRRLSNDVWARWSVVAICAVMFAQIAFLVFGCDWDLCADEAEYWAWSRQS